MNRIKQAWLALTGRLEPEVRYLSVDPGADNKPEGVLFGVDPPAGCQFEVSCHRGESWHVRITRNGRELARDCSLIGRTWGDGNTDEELIVSAAKRALDALSAAQARAHLEGCYPPKVAKGRGE